MASEKRQRQRQNQMLRATNEQQDAKRGRRTKLILRVVIIAIVLVGAAYIYSQVSDGPESVTTDSDSSDTTDNTDSTTDTDGTNNTTDTDGTNNTTDTDGTDNTTDTDGTNNTTDTDGTDNTTVVDTDSTDTTIDSATDTDGTNNTTNNTTDTDTTVVDTDTTVVDTATGCPSEQDTATRITQFNAPPPICIDADQLYAADFSTSLGDFTLMLDPSLDLASVNNFVVLARYGAYDGTIFHRVISGFVVQGGDVQGAFGIGNPGYRFTGGEPESGWYSVGAAAMANSGNASSNGSQFFIITGPNGAALPPVYSPLGRVTAGLDIVLAIDATPTGTRALPSGRTTGDVPITDVVVDSVTIRTPGNDEIADYNQAADG